MVPPGLKTIFSEALDRPEGAAQAAYLDEVCRGDAELRAHVEALIRDHLRMGRFLGTAMDTSPAHTGSDAEPDRPDDMTQAESLHSSIGDAPGPPLAERPGARVGPYKLLEPIGEGGMGTVWMAEQSAPVKRLVALKVVKAGMDSRQVLARFEAERQALALMDHPHIAKVLDAGATEAGRPYFVMELVKGVPITVFCDARRLTPRARLELFIPVCQAVQHAHQKGIIHRDLKPSNVLVGLYDGVPVPKVIDFGVAKATGEKLTEATLFTGCGAVIGTPEYMSPEQARLDNLDIDTRSDIYSLGVLLYELLTGTTPLDRKRLGQAALLEVLRVIREEESPRPSRRLSTMEGLASIAECRSIEPRRLSGLVRGELDWIAMKALEKDRNRRYETASGLAADLQRYLDDEPVQAGPPSAWYRSWKFARRNRVILTTAALVAAALVLGTIVSAWQSLRALRAELLAEARLKTSEANLYVSRIALAERELAAIHGARAEQLLDLCPVEQRGWEWHLLKRRLHEEPLVLPGHSKAIRRVAFSDDGRVLASVSLDGTVRFWDLREGACLRILQLTGGPPTRARSDFSLDGQWLASDYPDGSVAVWDLNTNRPRRLQGLADRARAVAFSPDGRHLAAACEDGTVSAWDLSGDERAVFAGHGDLVTDVAYSPDGQRLAAASEDRTVRVWDVRTRHPLLTLRGFQGGVLAVVFSPDGRSLATGARDGIVRIWDATTGNLSRVLRGHTGGVDTLAFSPDGRRLLSAAWDSTVRVWNPATGQETLALRDHTLGVMALAFSRDGRQLATAGYVKGDPGLRVWNATPLTVDAGPKPLRVFQEPAQHVNCVAFSRDGSLLASGGDDKTVRVRELVSGQLRHSLSGRSEFNALAFSPGAIHLAACDDYGFLQTWDVRTGREVFGRRVSPYSPQELSYSRDGLRLAMAVPGGFLRIFEAATGKDLLALDGQLTFVTSVAYSPDGRHLASSGYDKLVRIWDMSTLKPQVLSGHEAGVISLAYHPEGTFLASVGEDGLLILWNVASGREALRIRAHRDPVSRVRFSPDGRLLATASGDGTVKCWDTGNGRLLQLLRAHEQGAHDIAFHPDGTRLASAGADGTIKIWATPSSPKSQDVNR